MGFGAQVDQWTRVLAPTRESCNCPLDKTGSDVTAHREAVETCFVRRFVFISRAVFSICKKQTKLANVSR